LFYRFFIARKYGFYGQMVMMIVDKNNRTSWVQEEEMMIETRTINYSEQRRAIRIPWERPVRITQPVQAPGRSINVSAVGLLMRVEQGYPLSKGDCVSVEIPRADGNAILTRRGRITRVESAGSEMFLGLELI
jgi:hypothetical protein